jgi:Protein of unknown function (DUF2541)
MLVNKFKLFVPLVTVGLVSLGLGSNVMADQTKFLGKTQLSYSNNSMNNNGLNILQVQKKCSAPTKQGFKAVRVEAFKGSANIISFKIKYGNGKWDTLMIAQNLQQGSSTKWLDLRGDKRCLEAIAVIGKTSNNSSKPATLKIYGRR